MPNTSQERHPRALKRQWSRRGCVAWPGDHTTAVESYRVTAVNYASNFSMYRCKDQVAAAISRVQKGGAQVIIGGSIHEKGREAMDGSPRTA
ncbi:hypothetical protein VDGL01_09903 [Verticillium dahliae]